MERSIQTPDQAAAWLEGLINVEKLPDRATARLSLAPIRALLERVGNPERSRRPVHLAGSKGKGSTALLAEALLRSAGRRVGTFVQPHLERWTERFRIDGSEVSGARLAAVVERLREPVEALRQGPPETAPSWFDVTTAAALLLFEESELDAVVLEVGLGGRLDSTNVVSPCATAITSIELEHTEILGETLEAITFEKAGIVKAGVPVVTGVLPAAAREVVHARATELGAPLVELGVDLGLEVEDLGLDGSRIRVRDGALVLELDLPVPGRHQAENAAVALACVRRAGLLGDGELEQSAAAAFESVRLPGRIEILARDPLAIVDSCHTDASARALAEVIGRTPRARTHLVLSISSDKNLSAVARALAPLCESVTATRAEPTRSLAPEEMAPVVRRLAPGCEVHTVADPELALRSVCDEAAPDDLVVVAGSVYLAGIARRVLGAGGSVGGR